MARQVKKKTKKKKDDKVAYTPLTEKQKDEAMKQLIKNLHDPNHPAGNYRSPGGPSGDWREMFGVKKASLKINPDEKKKKKA
tara:strand:+ start:2171 stop:2416 length:246 start_codon:yes stop_codon:yes gene_type:complete